MKKKRKKRRKVWIHDFEYGTSMETMILYGILWVCMDYYGLV